MCLLPRPPGEGEIALQLGEDEGARRIGERVGLEEGGSTMEQGGNRKNP